jgi:hypothetical protein
MIVIGLALLGAILGGMRAKARGGKPADIAQYAAAHAIAFALVGLVATIALHRAL